MTKKRTTLFLTLAIFTLSLIIYSNTKENTSQAKSKAYESKAINHKPIQKEGSMKLAWYRFFNLQQTSKKQDLSVRPKLTFEQNVQKSKGKFLVFDIRNQSTKDVVLPIQNGSLIMIQEAQTKTGQWRPIEYWCYDWGQGSIFDKVTLRSEESIEITAPKYSGTFKTKIRFKLKTGQTSSKDLYYSKPFEGTINASQFKLDQSKLRFDVQKISYLEK